MTRTLRFFSLRFPFYFLSLIHFIIIIIIGDIFFVFFLKYFCLPYTYIYAYEREKKRKRRNRLYSFLSILLSVVVLCRSSILREIRFFYFLLAIAWRQWRPRSSACPRLLGSISKSDAHLLAIRVVLEKRALAFHHIASIFIYVGREKGEASLYSVKQPETGWS
jgi:hypothetical protein